jgi:[acyl-carrier-protein] S-malonyltransferase
MFPGQGSQYVGMMKELAKLEVVKELLEKARPILGYDILDICVNGPVDKLSKTVHCQPAMFISGLAAYYKLMEEEPQKAKNCTAMAGLSLGEYTALVAAGVMTFEEGLSLVKVRAEAMEAEANPPAIEGPMGMKMESGKKQLMCSIAGLDQSKVEELCAQSAAKGQVCQIANHLFPKGFACAGHGPAIEKLETVAKEAGALQAKILETSGAFHTPLMSGARTKLVAKLEEVKKTMKPPKCAVYLNVDAKPIGGPTPFNADKLVEMMGDQLTNAVMWEQSMKAVIADGCTEFIECGPSKQLKAMMKRIDPKMVNNTTNVLA